MKRSLQVRGLVEASREFCYSHDARHEMNAGCVYVILCGRAEAFHGCVVHQEAAK